MEFPRSTEKYLPKESGNPLLFYIRGTEVVVYSPNLAVPPFDCELNRYVICERGLENE